MERRIILGTEVRAEPATETSGRRLSGYAAVFNSMADLGRFQERIAPGAFRDALGSKDQVALWNHNSDYPLARKSKGTLRMQEDERGLAFSLDLPNSMIGDMASEAITRGDVVGMSFGFTVPDGGDEWAMINGRRTRTLVRADLQEISPVTFPAFPATSVEARSLEALADEAERRVLVPVPVDIRRRQTYLRSL